jgi:hypothetical protein
MLETILAYVLPILASVLTALATYALRLLARRFKLDIDARAEAAIRLGIRRTIFAVEEAAARRLKVESKPTDKGKLALDVLAKLFPDMLPEELARMLDEELGQTPGVGASAAPTYVLAEAGTILQRQVGGPSIQELGTAP